MTLSVVEFSKAARPHVADFALLEHAQAARQFLDDILFE